VSLVLELTSCAGQQVVGACVKCVSQLLVMVSQTAHMAGPHLSRSAPFCCASGAPSLDLTTRNGLPPVVFGVSFPGSAVSPLQLCSSHPSQHSSGGGCCCLFLVLLPCCAALCFRVLFASVGFRGGAEVSLSGSRHSIKHTGPLTCVPPAGAATTHRVLLCCFQVRLPGGVSWRCRVPAQRSCHR
jgi:hypothetical protein